MKVLQTKDIRKTYGRIVALDNLNLELESGQVLGLLGPNGSGKTTTLGILLGILSKDSGSYEWFEGKYGDKHRMKIGAILETPNFYPYLDAEKNLEIIAKIKNVKDTNFDEVLKIVDLIDRRKSKFLTYSLGMKQRLAIAATLVGEPEVVIFDEPTNGLDPQGIAEVRHILKRVADSGKSVIMASHILDEVEKICSHTAIIKNGKLLASGPIGAILSNDDFLELGATDLESLRGFLVKHDINVTDLKEQYWECTVPAGYNPASIVAQAVSEGHQITHVVIRKRRLEEEFLQITNN